LNVAIVALLSAYITWSLTYAGISGLDGQIETLVKQAETSSDAYFLGLVSGILFNVKRTSEAEALADKVKFCLSVFS
jgi:hypothetical protein